MTTPITRRGILKALGIGAAAAIIDEPIRKLWFVSSSAPVGSRVERPDFVGAHVVVAQPSVDRDELLRKLWTKVRSQADLDTLRHAARIVETNFTGDDRDRLMEDYAAGLRAQKRYMGNIQWDPDEEYEADHANNQVATLILST